MITRHTLLIVLACTVARAEDAHPPFNPRTVIDRSFKAITQAPFVDTTEVEDEVRDNELVLGVIIDGKARAYPINQLTGPSREIINDTLGGRSIAATW